MSPYFNNKQMEKTLKEEIIEILRVCRIADFERNGLNYEKFADQIISLILSRLPKELIGLVGDTLASGLFKTGYDQAIEDIKNLLK